MSGDFEGVILAGGRGSRMAPFSERYPKPLLPIGNRPLIEHQIEMMRALGILEITILIGHKGFELACVLGDGQRLGVRIQYVEQTTVLGIAHAVGCLEKYVQKPFLLFLGDIFFVQDDIGEMLRLYTQQDGGAVLATKFEADPAAIRKNFSLKINDEGLVTRVIEKPRHITSKLKGVGIYLFDLTIFDAIRRTPRTAMRDEYEITDSIQVMIQDGYTVRASNCILDDMNLTTPADLLACNVALAKQVGTGEQVLGPNLKAHPNVEIVNSVIGANVTIPYPIRIENSLVFPDTTVSAQSGFEGHIVTPELHLDCNTAQITSRVQWA